ncbi:MAG: hypothetical protein ACRDOI_22795 [Trebonia sp.]
MCAIVQRHPDAVVALAEAAGVALPEHDQAVAAPDAHPMRDGRTVYTDGTVRLLRQGEPVFFATVEMQRKFGKDKYATLHAYHGSGVRNVNAGGHLFVLSDEASETARFRAEDAARRAELAFAGSFHSGQDLRKLEDAERLGARALPAALAGFGAGVPEGALELLEEMRGSDLTLANLYLRTIVEEVPDMTMVGEALRPDMFERLRELESFREYEAKVEARAKAAAEAGVADAKAAAEATVAKANATVAEANATVAEANATVAEAKAAAEATVAEAKAQTEAATVADNLAEFLILRGDAPSEHALNTISDCRNAGLLASWLKRAYLGETSAQLFPEP